MAEQTAEIGFNKETIKGERPIEKQDQDLDNALDI